MKSQSAVTLLLSILVLGAIGLSITISMTLAGINRSQTSHEYEKKIRAQSLAIACTEEAFEQIRADNNFTGTGSLNL